MTDVPTGAGDQIVPDTRDWTWTLERPCPECGLGAASIPAEDTADHVMASTSPWVEVLARPDVRRRPTPATWSPLGYACHGLHDLAHHLRDVGVPVP